MIEVMPESEGNLLVLRARDRLTHSDYSDVLIPRLEEIIHDHGKARFLLDLGDDFQGWEPAAMWDDTRFGLTHRKDFDKMGVVGGPWWVDMSAKALGWAMGGELRTFAPQQRNEAVDWVKKESSPESVAAATRSRRIRLAIGSGIVAGLLVLLASRTCPWARRR